MSLAHFFVAVDLVDEHLMERRGGEGRRKEKGKKGATGEGQPLVSEVC